jgi:3-methyladenine DNA glycosylase AlkD
MKSIAEKIRSELRGVADTSKVQLQQGFFKTGPGQYGEGDVFLGVTVPQSRKIANSYQSADLDSVRELLRSKVHEERLVALLILVGKYDSGENGIADFYLEHLQYVNNWDLVDLTASNILGKHLDNKDRSLLYKLARSSNVWERRIAIVATYHFIRSNDFGSTFRIAEVLLGDSHDLIHKASGWMLREVGKRNVVLLENFLDHHYKKMPRTMLRYAIERLPERRRKFYISRESR